jgi:hypothetical protein
MKLRDTASLAALKRNPRAFFVYSFIEKSSLHHFWQSARIREHLPTKSPDSSSLRTPLRLANGRQLPAVLREPHQRIFTTKLCAMRGTRSNKPNSEVFAGLGLKSLRCTKGLLYSLRAKYFFVFATI